MQSLQRSREQQQQQQQQQGGLGCGDIEYLAVIAQKYRARADDSRLLSAVRAQPRLLHTMHLAAGDSCLLMLCWLIGCAADSVGPLGCGARDNAESQEGSQLLTAVFTHLIPESAATPF
jgi:hypothetical protein